MADGEGVAAAPPPWRALKVAVIDDAMHPPRLDQLEENRREAVTQLLTKDDRVLAELATLAVPPEASIDDRLRALAATASLSESGSRVGEASPEAARMIDEHIAFLNLMRKLTDEVSELMACDPFRPLPDLSGYDLILLDYYLQGPAKGGDLAVDLATAINGQAGRANDQQIVLMSSLDTVRNLRGEFRARTGIAGSAYAFIGKPDLNERWKIKAHLGMLERARPYSPKFARYRERLETALEEAKDGLLALVDDLDLGDYAFLQGRALKQEGHPLGDYVFWLLSSQFLALGFENDDMRERQHALDELGFVGGSFSSTEPSTVVAKLLHSALVSRSVGSLGPHPGAAGNDKYAACPLVQLGDVFLDGARTKAMVVMSADCDLAFSPSDDRPPDRDTPVMLVPGVPVRLKEAKGGDVAATDGMLHREEVFRINWDFKKYRSVSLGELEAWLIAENFDVSNRDRLRPLFALKLQQEFGAHLMRVGPPVMPPVTTPAKGRILVCSPQAVETASFTMGELMVSWIKGIPLLRVTPPVASKLKDGCEDLLSRLKDELASAKPADRLNSQKKIAALTAKIEDDEFWIKLLEGVELSSVDSLKPVGPLKVVRGEKWQHSGSSAVVLEIVEAPQADGPRKSAEGTAADGGELVVSAA